MRKKSEKTESAWVDPDDAPPWTKEDFARAELTVGGKVIRPASGTLTRGPGRPRLAAPKQHVSVRLDADLLEHFRATGPGWQTRLNDTLRKAVGL